MSEPSERTELTTNVPIVVVTLLEDRAHVTRRAELELEAGITRLRVEAVSPVIADKSLVAKSEGGALRIIDARVVRRAALSNEGPGDLDALRRERDALADEAAAADGARRALEEQRDLLDALATLSLEELAIDVSWGRAPSEEADAKLADLDERRADARRELVAHDRQRNELDGRRKRLARRILELEDPSSDLVAGLEIDLFADDAGAYPIAIDYVVPGACWRPHHTAELGDGEVVFSTDGCVWQNTGEDWTDVALVFSTERASLGTAPPTLTSDVLRVRRRAQTLEVEARDATVKEASLGAAGRGMPGIDDGGDPLALRASERADVPSDGRPHRVALARFATPSETELVCFPELDAAVILKSTQHNAAPKPILAGPVDLIRDSGLCGKTSVLFIGPNERFELGWGPETEIRVQRDVDVKGEDASMLSSWVELKNEVEVRLSNLGQRSRRVHVRERIPVSEIEKVKVEPIPDETTDGRGPDEDGFVDWEVELDAHATTDIVLRYRVKKHGDVVGL